MINLHDVIPYLDKGDVVLVSQVDLLLGIRPGYLTKLIW